MLLAGCIFMGGAAYVWVTAFGTRSTAHRQIRHFIEAFGGLLGVAVIAAFVIVLMVAADVAIVRWERARESRRAKR